MQGAIGEASLERAAPGRQKKGNRGAGWACPTLRPEPLEGLGQGTVWLALGFDEAPPAAAGGCGL